ncbi:MAG: YggS family pyridoxal phosphate-dependent enzyme [Acidobacteriota bacterium]|nr:YggS family pyridoxal phosphate-dependent enzyme [Acidobacteriota bacterium]
MSTIVENIQWIRDRIAAAAASCNRSPDDITLLPISKTFPVDSISQAAAAGISRFGENRVQEAEKKILHFRSLANLEWHLVGHLQSNKAKRAAELFDVIHSVDSIKLATRLSQACVEIGKVLSVLIQVDLGGEDTKFGAEPDSIADIVRVVSGLKGIRINGLMTIPPFFEDPDKSRPYFARLRDLRDTVESELPGCLGERHLSMGMSHDFEAAIREGSTMVRIGTAIFGTRQ